MRNLGIRINLRVEFERNLIRSLFNFEKENLIYDRYYTNLLVPISE